MSSLLEIQRGFRRALLDGDDAVLAALTVDDRIAPAARLDVYRNNVLSSLTTVLKDVFPVVCRLVDERFFDYAADNFVRAHPPQEACLHAYGQHFPDFLAAFPPCRDLVYLSDVARLEWLLQGTARASDRPAVPLASLASVQAMHAPWLVFTLQPSHAYLESPWPVDRIWRANRPGAIDNEAIDLASGGARIELRRHDGDVEMRVLPAGDFAFRAALSRQATFAAATEAGIAADVAFDPVAVLSRLFTDAAVADLAIAEGAP